MHASQLKNLLFFVFTLIINIDIDNIDIDHQTNK